MMNTFFPHILPFDSYGDFKLYQSEDEARAVAKARKYRYTTEIWRNSECTNPVPWTVMHIEKKIHLFFAMDKLFKIYLDNDCPGMLPNGIAIGMPIQKALEADSGLIYDDWEEDYQSAKGYWLEDDLETNTVLSISIFIKEAMDDEVFDRYEW